LGKIKTIKNEKTINTKTFSKVKLIISLVWPSILKYSFSAISIFFDLNITNEKFTHKNVINQDKYLFNEKL
tara:strand:- start:41 stop:253 length:213 start_codon:yes stop_codon:yes gene_type:complete